MENRRTFLKKGALAAAAVAAPSLPGCVDTRTIRAGANMKTRTVKRVQVLWFSQTGYTRRHGRLLAATLEKTGITVTSGRLKDADPATLSAADLLVVGSPVFYYDTPETVKNWIRRLPPLSGTPVAAYVTFGGPEGNQHNAACSILQELAEKGGVPVGMGAFMNMSSFPLAWAGGEVHEKTWMSRHLPDEKTYAAVRRFSREVVSRVEKGAVLEVSRRITLREMATFLGPVWWTKKFVDKHCIDQDRCIGCGTCEDVCPAGAIDPGSFTVDRDACVLCFGCINNCPADAVHMEYGGERVIGYRAFLRQKGLVVKEPRELEVDTGGKSL